MSTECLFWVKLRRTGAASNGEKVYGQAGIAGQWQQTTFPSETTRAHPMSPSEVAVHLVALDTDAAYPETYPHGPFGWVSLR